MTVKAENTVGYDDIKELCRTSSASVKIMLCIFSAAMLVLVIISVFTGNSGRNLHLGIAGLIWCLVVYAYIFVLNPRILYNRFRKNYGSSPVKFTFYQQNMSVSADCGENSFDIRKNYSDIFKITETDSYFFINFRRNEAYILKKGGITEGSSEDIRSIISREMGMKYTCRVKGK